MKNKTFLGVSFFLVALFSLSINAFAQQTVKLYPSTLRIEKGKTKTVTAVAVDGNGNRIQNAQYNFVSNNTNVVATSQTRLGESLTYDFRISQNLSTLNGVNAGTATIYATSNGIKSNAITVLVDDPSAAPTAIVHGDNDASGGTTITTKVGEPVEVNAEDSRGVSQIEWSWGDDDKTTNLLSSTHSYLKSGTYTLALTVKNSSGASAISTITVNVQPHTVGRIVKATSIAAIEAAYNNAQAGDVIEVPAGTVLTGTLTLNPKSNSLSDYVTIRSSAAMPNLANRVSPNQNGLVTIRSGNSYSPALYIKSNEVDCTGGNCSVKKKNSKIRFVGIKFDVPEQNDVAQFLVAQVGDFYPTTNLQDPEKIIFEHCVINPPGQTEVMHGVFNEGYKIAFISSWLGNILAKCFDTGCNSDAQAVYSIAAKGAHVYNNTFLEATTESIIYGGDDVRIEGHVVTNIELRRCHFYKRPEWLTPNENGGFPYNVKNHFEFKLGRRAYFEGNIFENMRYAGQPGQQSSIAINTLTDQSKNYWLVTEDIVIENNKLLNVATGVINGGSAHYGEPDYDFRKINNVLIKNVLFDRVSKNNTSLGGQEHMGLFGPIDDYQMNHVTLIVDPDKMPSSFIFTTISAYRFKILNSILASGSGQVGGFTSSDGRGLCTLNAATGGLFQNNTFCDVSPGTWTYQNNVMLWSAQNEYNGENPFLRHPDFDLLPTRYPSSYADFQFENFDNHDYRLKSTSPYKGLANGKDPGADMPLLNQRTACTTLGIGTNCSGPSSNKAVVFNGTNYAVTAQPLPSSFNSLGGFQFIWRVRGAGSSGWQFGAGAAFITNAIPSFILSDFREHINLYSRPSNYNDSICKVQFDPTNSRWTFETWNADGSGYVLQTHQVTNTSNVGLGGSTVSFGGNEYGNFLGQSKIDYWGWINRVEPLGNFPGTSLPSNVNYLLKYEFNGNGNDSSGTGINLTYYGGTPTFENTP